MLHRKITIINVALLTCIVSSGFAAEPEFSTNDGGFSINSGPAGNFEIKAPTAKLQAGGEEKGTVQTTSPDQIRITYGSGAQLDLTATGDQLTGHYSHASLVRSFVFSFNIPMKYKEFGHYAFDQAAPTAFPSEPEKVHVQHGSFHSVTVSDPLDRGFTLITPGGYQGVQDNRPEGWGNVFVYHYQLDSNGKDEGYFQFQLKPFPRNQEVDAPAKKKFIADRYGQSDLIDFPGKVTSDEELKADAAEQIKQMASFEPNPKLDNYGGLKGSGEKLGLEATGFFHVADVKGRQVLVTPDGNAFFQLAVCGIANTDDFTKVAGRETDFEWLPQKNDKEFRKAWRDERPDWGNFSFYVANWIRKFGKDYDYEEWTAQVVDRLHMWGFNSAGAFSIISETMHTRNFPYVSSIGLNNPRTFELIPDKIGAGYVMDPFAKGVEEKLDRVMASEVAPKANDPLLIGYSLGNEQHFEDLPKLLPTYKASEVAAKAKLVEMLKDNYGTIEAFNAAWNPTKPFGSFAELEETPLFVRSEAAAADMQAFFRLFMETYYAQVEHAFRKYDQNHLLIGNRWTPNTANNKTVVEVGGEHLDVLSINYYTYGIDKDFLTKVHEWSGGKPIILSEWYFSSSDRGLSASKEVADQEARGKAYRNYVEQSASLPFVVGSQWFIYTDQALTGRFFEGFNGEGNNTGLVDVTDRPYEALVNAATLTNGRIYDVMFGDVTPYAYADPKFSSSGAGSKIAQAPKALGVMKLDGTTADWPGRPADIISSDRVVIGLKNNDLQGAFRACWDKDNLYLLIHVQDPTPMKNQHSGGKLWAADCVELFIGSKNLNDGGGMIYGDYQILVGASDPSQVHVVGFDDKGESIQVFAVKDVSGDGYTMELSIPWSTLEVTPKPGTELLFDIAIDNSSNGQNREQQLVWNGTSRNSGDRGSWGRLKLVAN